MQVTNPRLPPVPTPSTNWREKFITDRGEETTREGERPYLEAAAKRVQEIMGEIAQLGDGKVRPGQHAVTHWAGDVQLEVRTDIPEWARCGIFTRVGETFLGKIRLSGGVGFLQSDKVGDVRGCSLDVIVDGMHQGFLATSRKAPFVANGYEFIALVEAMLKALTAGKRVDRLLIPNKRTFFIQLVDQMRATRPETLSGRFLALIQALRIHIRLAQLTARGPLHMDKSLANLQFWSGGPLKIGPFAARFTLIPHRENGLPIALAGGRSDDYLSEEIRARLRQGDIKYTLAMQFFVDEKKTPIETAYKGWDNHAIAIPTATVTIKRDTPFDPAAAEYRYTQSHTLGDITDVDEQGYPKDPSSLFSLSHIMRIRELAYEASADARGGTLQPIDAT